MFRHLIAIAVACLASSALQAQERDLKFTLDFISLGLYAPSYVALDLLYQLENRQGL